MIGLLLVLLMIIEFVPAINPLPRFRDSLYRSRSACCRDLGRSPTPNSLLLPPSSSPPRPGFRQLSSKSATCRGVRGSDGCRDLSGNDNPDGEALQLLLLLLQDACAMGSPPPPLFRTENVNGDRDGISALKAALDPDAIPTEDDEMRSAWARATLILVKIFFILCSCVTSRWFQAVVWPSWSVL